MAKLVDLAKTIRSKNAGVDLVTFDVVFRSEDIRQAVEQSGTLTRATVCELFGVSPDDLLTFVWFPPATALKFTMRRQRSSGSPGDADVFGSQQYAPLIDLTLDLPGEQAA